MKTGKINCIIVDDEPVAREILESHLGKIDRICVVASCRNAVEAFKAIHDHPVDLVFLDINMPDISGLSFARSMSGNFKVIFTTAYREYAVDGFDLKAVDYLLKPIPFERLLQGINKYLEENASQISEKVADFQDAKEDFMFIRSDRKMVKVNFSEIVYIESLSDYVKIHLGDQKVLMTRDTISNIESRLPHEAFIRVHRSYVVAISKIESFSSDTIGIGKYEIPISRSFREGVVKRLEGK